MDGLVAGKVVPPEILFDLEAPLATVDIRDGAASIPQFTRWTSN